MKMIDSWPLLHICFCKYEGLKSTLESRFVGTWFNAELESMETSMLPNGFCWIPVFNDDIQRSLVESRVSESRI
ncbi:hypothetical protein KM043_002594 [Ampulex compressa]|nr:hypothetical protein KM043_002594 [Ampulex compressa]